MIDTVFCGDCLETMKQFPDETVNVVYLDPPFFTQRRQSLKSRDLTEYSFDDSWDSIKAYIDFLQLRITEIRRVMKNDATIFVHCDRKASHHIRLLLDEIFGHQRFLSEIIWTYKRWSNASKNLLPAHQTIFMYSKSADYTFNKLIQPYSQTTNLDQILQKRERDENGKTVYAEDADGQVILNGPKKGVPLSDTWEIPYLNPKARERTGYPTQKPILLLERIIKLSSQPDDIVLDPFCGSGTTLVAAKLLGRKFIGIDISEEAISLSQKRLANPIKSESPLMKKGRKSYDNLPDYVQNILCSLPVKLVQRNAGIDAIYNQYINDRPLVLRVQRIDEILVEAANKLKHAGHKKDASMMILIQTEQSGQQTLINIPLPEDIILVDALHYSIQQSIEKLFDLHHKKTDAG